MKNFLALVRYAINDDAPVPEPMTVEEWKGVFEIAMKQTVTGVVFHGIQKLPKEMMPEHEVLMAWIGMAMRLRKKNELLFKRAAQAKRNFERCGYRNCILKGQGNAMMYPDPYMRTPGDIDIWLDGRRLDIIRFVKGMFRDVKFKFQHIDFPAFKDAAIEVHYMPMYTQNPITNRRLQVFFKREKETQMTNVVELPDGYGEIAVPTPYFNAVYQITHLFIHFVIEGIGLRQFVDYYYVLRNLPEDRRDDVVRMLKDIKMYKFAQAVMYVEKEMLGLEDEYVFIPVDEKNGRRLAEEIMIGGNFGHYETRYWSKDGGFWEKQVQKIKRNSRFMLTYPSEELCEPFFRLYHFLWRCYVNVRLKLYKSN